EPGHFVSHRRGPRDRALQGCVLSVPDLGRRQLAFDRPGALVLRETGPMAFRRAGRAGHPGRRRQAVPDAGRDGAAALAVLHGSCARPLGFLDAPPPAGAGCGMAWTRRRTETGRAAAGSVGPGAVPGRRRENLSVLGLVQRLSDPWRATRFGVRRAIARRRQARPVCYQTTGAVARRSRAARLGTLRQGPQ